MAELDIVIGAKTLTNKEVGTTQDFQRPGNGGSAAIPSSDPMNNVMGNSGANIVMKSIAANQMANAALQSMKQIANYAKNSYGDFTGDYLGQTKIDRAFEVAGTVASVAGSIGSGFMVGGPVGAAVAAGVQFINLATTAVQNDITYQRGLMNRNTQAAFNSSRIGLPLVNGNRG